MGKLTRTELLEMDLNFANQKNEELLLENLKIKHTNKILSTKIKNLEDQIKFKNETEAFKKESEHLEQRVEKAKSVSRKFNNKISRKYKLKGSWGINPDNGEIIKEKLDDN